MLRPPQRPADGRREGDVARLEAELSSSRAAQAHLLKTGFSGSRMALGMVLVNAAAYLCGRSPAVYIVFHTCLSVCVTVASVMRKAPRRQLAYMLDFCWAANMAVTAYGLCVLLALATGSGPLVWLSRAGVARLLRVIAILAAGPLGLPVLGLGNPLVLHSVDHFIAIFIHFSPNVLVWCLRWHVPEVVLAFPEDPMRLSLAVRDESWVDSLHVAFMFYLAWWVLYVGWMLVDGLGRPAMGYVTVYEQYRFLSMRVGKWFRLKDPRAVFLLYMSVHGMLALATMCLGVLSWNYKWFHTAYVAMSFISACFHGAVFYEKHLAVPRRISHAPPGQNKAESAG